MAEYGVRYQPGVDVPMAGGGGSTPSAAGARPSSPQQAVRILSLRVPPALPANAPVSRSLLTSPGSAVPGGNALNSMVQALLQAFKPAPTPGAPTLPTFPPQGTPPSGAPSSPSMPSGGGMTRPTFPTQSAPQPVVPTPEGTIDTPPMQNAPPLFDEAPQNFNAYERLMTDPNDRFSRDFMDWIGRQFDSPRLPTPGPSIQWGENKSNQIPSEIQMPGSGMSYMA